MKQIGVTSALTEIAMPPSQHCVCLRTIIDGGMKTLERQRRLPMESDLTERAWHVLQDSRELIQEMRALAARREQLLTRKDKIALEVLGNHS